MTLYTLENLIQIACFDVSSSKLVILSEIKVRMPLIRSKTIMTDLECRTKNFFSP